MKLGPRRAAFLESEAPPPLPPEEHAALDDLDLLYRSLCALLYNYAPLSGHPGGSISAGRILQALLFDNVDIDLGDPGRPDADAVVFAAGHKAMGLYALWALRDEIAARGAPGLLPRDAGRRLRLEDLLGFRKGPHTATPLFLELNAKALDGHPTPATPFVPVATGASGVGLGSAVGLAIAALDAFGEADAPRIHALEGEGGLTPGRAQEALAAASAASLRNLVVHVDWNQSSIDTDAVCRDGAHPGEYVQWDPRELFHLHDWNVVDVADGMDIAAVLHAQRRAARIGGGQPTAIVYRTVKGFRYGIEGRAAHGAGHKLCSPGFFNAVAGLQERLASSLPCCEGPQRCEGGARAEIVERCCAEALLLVRDLIERQPDMVEALAPRLVRSKERLDARHRRPRSDAPRIEAVYGAAATAGPPPPAPGTTTTLRGELGRALGHLNHQSGGALLCAAADLLGSTSIAAAAEGFPPGYFRAGGRGSRVLSIGGICEDAMSAVLSGISSAGFHIGVGSSYGAFIAPLGHIAARLHAIGGQARGGPQRPMILVCAHAGLKTGEDGPTHADPQPLQLLQGNFPEGAMFTLTPWEPQEIWPLLSAALLARPAVIAPFVTRPPERVPDRTALGLAPAAVAANGVYLLRAPRGEAHGTVVLQGSAVTYAFVHEALPLLDAAGIDLEVFYVASEELFDQLPKRERAAIFPEEKARRALGITDFTLPTLYRWVTSERGRAASLHPFARGHYLGSGAGPRVLEEAGLDGAAQARAIRRYLER